MDVLHVRKLQLRLSQQIRSRHRTSSVRTKVKEALVDCKDRDSVAFFGTDKHLSSLNSWYEVEHLRQYSRGGLLKIFQNKCLIPHWLGTSSLKSIYVLLHHSVCKIKYKCYAQRAMRAPAARRIWRFYRRTWHLALGTRESGSVTHFEVIASPSGLTLWSIANRWVKQAH
ncbi:hypothetical protein Syun_025229 [Stephania yunnanensis]|uniref:Uncharacterized protein n=1 Tax=Stephania yunnanensis TaxID=152371 RepID=A0AAP0F040_9MAGN